MGQDLDVNSARLCLFVAVMLKSFGECLLREKGKSICKQGIDECEEIGLSDVFIGAVCG